MRPLAVFVVSMLFAGSAGAEPDHHPNILLIIADDVGAEMFASHPNANSTPASTPTLDAVAAAGVRFTNVWSNPVCATTRATLMTGRYAYRTGISGPGGTLSLTETTLPEKLRAAGYKSAMIGKWGLSTILDSAHAVQSGFDYFSGSPGALLYTPDGPSDYYRWNKYFGKYDPLRPGCDGSHDDIDCVDTTGSPVLTAHPDRDQNYATTVNVNDALAWIDQNKSSPWFLVLGFNAAHGPFQAPPFALHGITGLIANYGGDRFCEPAQKAACYRAMIKAMDAEIGRLRAELGAMGEPGELSELGETVVIFVGDNGSPDGAGVRDPGRSKGTLFQGGVNVPLIVSGPGVLPSGVPNPARVSHALVNTSDLFTTVLDLANADAALAVDHDSYSFAPILAGVTGEVRHYAYAEAGGIDDQIADGVDKNGWGSAKAIRDRLGLKLHRRNEGQDGLSWHFHYLPAPGSVDSEGTDWLGGDSLAPVPPNPFVTALIQQLLPVFGGTALNTPKPPAPNLPAANLDRDDDGYSECAGPGCDNCPSVPNPGQEDADADGVGDACDGCRALAQDASLRCDTDRDGYANLCDGDFDNDGFTFPSDLDIWYADFTTTGTDGGKKGTDMNCDGSVDSADFPHWNDQFQGSGVPGPSGILCAGKEPCVVP